MPFSQTWIQQACMFRSASLFTGTSVTVAVFTKFATSNADSIVGIHQKIYSIQNMLIHIILIHIIHINPHVKCAHLHLGYAANLVARSRYYHCHWTLLMSFCEWYCCIIHSFICVILLMFQLLAICVWLSISLLPWPECWEVCRFASTTEARWYSCVAMSKNLQRNYHMWHRYQLES